MKIILTLLISVWMALPASAVEPSEVLADPALEERAREISADLRCLVCQTQSIDDSDAQLAKDLRLLVRERLVQGETDAQVKEYIVSRYGEFVLLTPPFNSSTYVLWYGPPVFAFMGLIALFIFFRRNRRSPAQVQAQAQTQAQGLSAAEQRRLEALLDHEEVEK